MTENSESELIEKFLKIVRNRKLIPSEHNEAIRGLEEINTKDAAIALLDVAEIEGLVPSSRSLALSLARQILRNLRVS